MKQDPLTHYPSDRVTHRRPNVLVNGGDNETILDSPCRLIPGSYEMSVSCCLIGDNDTLPVQLDHLPGTGQD